MDKKVEKSLELMKKLDICTVFVDMYKLDNEQYVCYYDRYIGYWVYQDEELFEKMKEIEKEYNCKVYAITHEYTDFGELYDFLIVDDYEEDWDSLLSDYDSPRTKLAYAYVWNKTDDMCSEFERILVDCKMDGLRRIG